MLCFVVLYSVEEINNEIKQKTRKCCRDIKKPKNVNVLTKRTKINALECLSAYSSNE